MTAATVRPAGACTLCGGSETRERFVKLERRFLECRGCGLVWIDPMPTPADLDAYYSAAYSGGRYSAFAEAQEIRRLISEHRLERVRAIAKPPGETVPRWLDIEHQLCELPQGRERGCVEVGDHRRRRAREMRADRPEPGHAGTKPEFRRKRRADVGAGVAVGMAKP